MPKPKDAGVSGSEYRDTIARIVKLSDQMEQETRNLLRYIGTGVKHPIPPGPKGEPLIEGIGKVIFATSTLSQGIRKLEQAR
jgi:hypothetical protein